MANTSVANDHGRDDHVRALLEMAKELKTNIQANDKKIQDLRNRKDGDKSYRKKIDESLASDIEELYKVQEVLKKSFYHLDKYFVVADEHGNLALSEEGHKEKELILTLKVKVESLKKHQKVLNEKLEGFLSIIEVSSDDDDEAKSTNRNDMSSWCFRLPEGGRLSLSAESSLVEMNISEKIDHLTPILLSKKLKLINYYYLQQGGAEDVFPSSWSLNLELQHNYSWLRKTRERHLGNEGGIGGDSDQFEAKDTDEMGRKIRRLICKRRKEMESARNSGKKKSFMEWMIADKDTEGWTILKVIHTRARQLGIFLSRHVCDCLFVVVENGDSFSMFRDHLKGVIKLLDKLGKTVVIRRVNSVVEAAEDYLSTRREAGIPPVDSAMDYRANQVQKEKMDCVLDMFLTEVLCLESILSYPSLSAEEYLSRTDKELKISLNALEVCEKEVEKIRLEMVFFKTIHNYLFDKKWEDLLTDELQSMVESKIAEAWESLEKGYEPN